MMSKISTFLDKLSDFLAHRKGLLPILAILLILANWVLQLLPGAGWIAQTNLLLHLGIVLAIIGFMLAWAL
jgi:hypothetical protein